MVNNYEIKNKINSIISAGSIAATLVPLSLTSCSKNTMYTVELEDFDETKVESPEGEITSVKTIDISKFYADSVKKDNMTFVNDLLYAEKMNYNLLKEALPNFEAKKYTIGISMNIDQGEIDYWHQGTHYLIPTFSFVYDWDVQYSFSANENSKLEYNIKHHTVYENVPLICFKDNGTNKWTVSSFFADSDYVQTLMYIDGWKVTNDIDFLITNTLNVDGKEEVMSEAINDTIVLDSYREVYLIWREISKDHDDTAASTIFQNLIGAYRFVPKSMDNVVYVEP